MSFFPTSVPTSLELLDARNNKSVTLSAAINDSVTSIPIIDTSSLPASGYVSSTDGSNEVIKYTSKTASTIDGCTRGADGTIASSHASGSLLAMWGNAAYHNELKDEVIAIAQNLSTRIGLGSTDIVNSQAVAGSALNLKAINTSTAASSEVNIYAESSSSTGDAYVTLKTPATSIALGLDASDSSKAKLTYGSAVLGTSDKLILDSTTLKLSTNVGINTDPAVALHPASSSNEIIRVEKTGSLASTYGVSVNTDLSGDTADLIFQCGSNSTGYAFRSRDAGGTSRLGLGITKDGVVSIKGTLTNDNATAGYVGEVISSTVSNTSITVSDNFYDITSITLDYGHWDMSGMVVYRPNGATFTAGNLLYELGIATASGTSTTGFVLGKNYAIQNFSDSSQFINGLTLLIASHVVKISSSTTFYLKGYIGTFTAGNPIQSANITATRRR